MFKFSLSNKITLATAAGFLFFSFALITLTSYGISWDEPTHFKRGQGYLWFLLTGENDYSKLPEYDLLKAQTDPDYHERSIFQDDKHNAAFYRTIDGTHPPLADILSSASNMIFYQKLGWLGDVESYHLFEIFIASLGVTILFLFVYETFGLLAALFSTVFFATYPLFWSESHFNIKDPIETSWIVITFYFLWRGVKRNRAAYILLSSIFAGLALGTKLNIIFLPLIITPWLFFLFLKQKEHVLRLINNKKFVAAIAFYPLIVFLIFYFTYPFLWEDPIKNIGKVLTYYQKNALDPNFANAVLPSWSFYALRWVILTTPPMVLLGLILGIISFKNNLAKHSALLVLIISWLFVTIARVSIPGVNIYGGVRQIMEFIPAICILAGVGFAYLIQKGGKVITLCTFAIVSAISIYPLIRLHPNENVYFNFLTGGLKGAVESGVPAAGNSFGNAYKQGTSWMNTHSINGAKLTILQGSSVNIPRYKLRPDINLSGDHFSGINREGEYIMALTFNWEHKENFYAWEYVEKFLIPAYEVKVDSIAILKIWKNDLEHTRSSYKTHEKSYDGNIIISNEKGFVTIDLDREIPLSRVVLTNDVRTCQLPPSAVIETSMDGKTWQREKDPLNFSQTGKMSGTFRPAWDTGKTIDKVDFYTINFYFPSRKAKIIRLVINNEVACLLNNSAIKVFYLDEN